MKPIGPYVAARDLGGDPAATVRTLRATDRLTGMPVLLHVLPHVAPLPALPDSPALLAPSEGGVDGETAYLVTGLPPHAHPARDPLAAARGGLEGLAALHAAGLTHGGVSPAQLWSVDGEVLLAGAALPWAGDPSPEADVRALLVALGTLGDLPPALRGVPETLTAADLLARLDAPPEAPPLRPPPAPKEPLAPPPGDTVDTAQEVGSGSLPTRIVATAAPQVSGGSVPQEGEAAAPAPPAPSARSARQRLSDDVRITWDADGTRRVVRAGTGSSPAPRQGTRRPAWLLPMLVLLAFVALVAALWLRQTGVAGGGGEAAASAPACCAVTFVVEGAAAGPVRLSVVRAPAGAGLKAGTEVGTAPGEVRLPGPGRYVLRVAADGYAPAEVAVTAPTSLPVTVDLAP